MDSWPSGFLVAWKSSTDHRYKHGLWGKYEPLRTFEEVKSRKRTTLHLRHPYAAQSQDVCVAEQLVEGLSPNKLQAAAHHSANDTGQLRVPFSTAASSHTVIAAVSLVPQLPPCMHHSVPPSFPPLHHISVHRRRSGSCRV